MGRWDEPLDEIAESLSEALGCLAPLLFFALILVGMKIIFIIMDWAL